MADINQILADHIIDYVNLRLANKECDNKVEGLSFKLSWSNSVSNSHCCPRNGVRNWGGKETYSDGTAKPRGYPGWHGRIWIRYSNQFYIISGSDPLSGSGVHIGTGGYGSYSGPWELTLKSIWELKRQGRIDRDTNISCYSWDCKVFAEDFPDIAEEYTTARAMLRLQGMKHDPDLYYLYTDPDVQTKDEELRQLSITKTYVSRLQHETII